MKLTLLIPCCLLLECSALVAPSKPVPAKQDVKTAPKTEAPKAPAAPQQKHARLDVGFASFEKTMLDHISKGIQSGPWSKDVQEACKVNATSALSQGLKAQLAALKQSIGKTWMSLPEDEQKDAYVSQLRLSYEPTFNDTIGTIETHLSRTLKRIHVHSSKPPSKDKLVEECESSIVSNIVDERCYDKGGDQHLKKVKSFLEIKNGAKQKFCMPSVLEAMTRRLHDSQGLIGMTMQFEAKSMSVSVSPSSINDLVASVSR